MDYWSWVMLNFDFLETVGKCLGIGSQPHVEYDFSRKMFFMLCSINWSIYWPDRLYFFKYCTLCTAIVCFLGCDVINFEFVRIFLIKMFSCMIKKSKEKCRYLDNEKIFQKKKVFFIVFRGLSIAKNRFRPESVTLRYYESLSLLNCIKAVTKLRLYEVSFS